jgi:hypothetical protein
MIEPLTIDELRGFVDDLKRRMVLMAYPDTDGARTYAGSLGTGILGGS